MAVEVHRIYRIARRFEESWRDEPFDADRRYIVRCGDPRFRLAVSHEALKTALTELDPELRPRRIETENDLLWVEFEFKPTDSHLAYGARSYRFNDHQTLAIQLRPSKYFDELHWCRMHEQIKQALGFPPWALEPGEGSSVELQLDQSFGDARAPQQFITDLDREIAAAESLLRRPYHAVEDLQTDIESGPEYQLLPVWAYRRTSDVAAYLPTMITTRERLQDSKRRAPNKSREEKDLHGRAKRYTGVERQLTRRQSKLRGIISRVRHLPRVVPQLTPAMQYDHRLRRLLKALRRRPDERLAEIATQQLSSHQPARAPDLFEAWCAVWCIRMLEDHGWQVERIRTSAQVFEKAVLDVTWHATKADLELYFDWSVAPTVVAVQPPVPVDQRDTLLTTVERFGQTLSAADDFEGGWIVWPERREPDFLLRMRHGSGAWVVGVGDPTLAFSGAKSKNKKPQKISSYVQQLFWLNAAGQPHRCDPLGGFAMFPGPRSAWGQRHENNAAKNDCWLVCPRPGVLDPDGAVARTWMRYIDHLTAVATRTAASTP